MVEMDVVDETTAAGQKPGVFGSRHGCADDGMVRRLGSVRGHEDAPESS
jgi:hypothetical protein